MTTSFLLLILGLVFLIKGADWLVFGASALARRFRIPDLVIGLTIVSFGTSAPELVVNSFAAFQNHPDIVLGNIIGSNNFNLFLILGISGLILPLSVQSTTVWKEIPFSLLAALVLLILANDQWTGHAIDVISRTDGIILLLFFALFWLYLFRQVKKERLSSPAEPETSSMSNWKMAAYILGGLVILIIGGKVIVNSAVNIARHYQISEQIISLTIVAAGTSLPELATSVVAAIRKNNDIAVGNVIGSNIFNIFFILAISSLIRPIHFDVSFNRDILLLIGGTLFLFIAMFTGKVRKLDRWEAALLLIAFGVYFYFIT
ncbi:calcium/sodium antiporter [Prolixibacter denitrificans]|uniref:Cation:H+ antiporter n=1 Tax=Prolixibacter denitrificans TaxID=1541063 RepID=A0A2P8CIN6_9BACT|nr:calcium/sodium antiporter [Prolixibacter denitrificans]PSK84828.1 cation:H+ antiporter [Prolixibacter denitrificans]GET20993.1 K+-dependent Na+/Ca+ exchanger [Prolixibacter denitrificans]